MEIVRSRKYKDSLQNIMETIAQDSVSRAISFQNSLDEQIEDLDFMPFKFRQSIYFDSKYIRDLIFKGYTIPYKIDESNNRIIIIGITKYKNEL